MFEFCAKITEFLVKYYNINRMEIATMIDDEYDYIEEEYNRGNDDAEKISKELLSIYMVA